MHGCLWLFTALPTLCHSATTVDLFRGIHPDKLTLYKAHIIHEATRQFTCLNGSAPTAAVLNDDFCDCPDGSDEPGTAACAGTPPTLDQFDRFVNLQEGSLPAMYSDRSFSVQVGAGVKPANPGFYCPQEGFYPRYIPHWKVNDNVCDCCDGSDEMPAKACPQTCSTLKIEFLRRREAHAQEEKELIEKGFQRYNEGLRKLKEWDALVQNGASRIEQLEKELETLKAEQATSSTEDPTMVERELDLDLEAIRRFEEEQEREGLLEEEDDGDEWVEEWNEDGSVKRVKKRTPLPPTGSVTTQSRLAELIDKLQHLWKRTVQKTEEVVKKLAKVAPQIPLPPTPPARKVAEDPVSTKNREINQLRTQYEQAIQKAQDELLRKFPQVVPWETKTVSWRIGEGSYSLPILGAPSFRMNWDPRIELGVFKEIRPLDEIQKMGWPEATVGRGVFAPWVLYYENGNTCNGHKIASVVYLVCAKEDELLVFEDQGDCRYTGTLATPAFCNVLDSNQKTPIGSHDEL
eukprot:Protomagalhaensia_sp_Gyna_25__2678@NODE_252_length_4177_cov_67_681730_g194_i0_p1_GENE_NODE_252_length_4177_cov_67_681730_g194_i0NODE_252_length_4177_cov_67_681730_g194_i0_p1_ORF_typecomplete_len518_score108_78PRKCSHlike/PF12999_7/3_9e39PRKCSHlike/PF12999_7/1_2e04PRKCSH_1/PF13015_6/3e08Ldl_recept_a/PF00057_18/0_0025Ldl_recept_a/PF00057_18/0_17AAA_23/PF13476_6/0_016AAA_23/PF13476_6/6_2e02DASH_Spc34/PF08657_10/0_12DASH_Spc34/PF08657_10/3_6e02Man6P_recep/PF02157_15/0_075Nsp1_C/PF05064_13/0_65Nsp1_C/